MNCDVIISTAAPSSYGGGVIPCIHTTIAIPLLHLDVGDDPQPRCPVHQDFEDVGVVTEDADCLGSIRRSMQHVTAQCDVCLSMCEYTVQLIYKLYVVLKRVAT